MRNDYYTDRTVTLKVSDIGFWACLKTIFGVFLAMTLWAVIALIVSWPVQLLWNWLCPALFSLPEITFWQAFALQILIALLTKISVKYSNDNS